MHAESLVILELQQCHAPVTGYFVSCAFITEWGTYLGHNFEKEHPTVFEHAETDALQKMLAQEQNPKIKRIIMYGGGNVKKMKYYIPCYTCAHVLEPFMAQGAIVELLPLAGTDHGLVVGFDEVLASYKDLPFSQCISTTEKELLEEIGEKTILNQKDLHFIVDLALFGKKTGIEFYLTGSSTGRGAVSTLILQKTKEAYRDLDIIASSVLELSVIENGMEDLIKKHYGDFTKEDRRIPPHQNTLNVVRKKTFYHHTPEQKGLIDFTLSKDFRGAFHYRQYELKNWFHRLA